jgi:hypothetical protein
MARATVELAMLGEKALGYGGVFLAAVAVCGACSAAGDGAPPDNVQQTAAGAAGSVQEQGSSGGNGGASAGMAGTSGGSGGSTETVDAGNAGAMQTGGSMVMDGASEQTTVVSGLDGGGKIPMCLTNDVAGGVNRATMQYVECDVEDQAIDFDVAANYSPPRKPGYDPSTTPVTITNFGSALTGYEVQLCHPYCYKGNLTLGVDVIASQADSLHGEALFDFPPTVAPIVAPAGRASLGWLFLDGPALPAGMTVTAQMVLKSKDKSLLVGSENKKITLKTWAEFRYFPIQQAFNVADLVNVTSIGFRLTFAATGTQEWHGVVYADHFQLRK